MDKEYWRIKKREQRAKLARLETVVVEAVPEGGGVVMEWDPVVFPDKEAFKIALTRAERARRYALKFPDFVRKGDEKYQSVTWQYENEGLKAVRKAETMKVR